MFYPAPYTTSMSNQFGTYVPVSYFITELFIAYQSTLSTLDYFKFHSQNFVDHLKS